METIPMILAYAADALLILASLGAAVFCLILARRLTRLSSIDNGLGGAIAVLSAQVDDMNTALAAMKSGSESSAERLDGLNREARQLTEELELMLSACHDLGQRPPKTLASEDQDKADPSPETVALDSPDETAAPLFGSRRHPPAPEVETQENPSVPFFLKKRSRLAGIG